MRHYFFVVHYLDRMYMGCYKDKDPGRDLWIFARSDQMSFDYCNEVCQGYKYFGVQVLQF